MIIYKSGFSNLFQLNGSVFPKALKISVPVSLLSGAMSFFIWQEGYLGPTWREYLAYFREEAAVMTDNAAWGGFSFFVGFLVVFRTSQAYSRFWEGTTSTHKMGAEWFDACAALVAFCRHSGTDREKVLGFQNLIVRLFSMLHAVALGELEDCGSIRDFASVSAFSLELIDGKGIDEDSLRMIRDSDAKVELLFQWIQSLIVENIKTGVLSIPPPILTRSYQELANGMVAFHDALKISKVPFPFPYAQTCDALLMIHWLIVPVVVSQWCSHPVFSFVFTFMQVFTLWSLNLIAVEIENPFGTDPNDVDGVNMQLQMNNNLRLLLRKEVANVPGLRRVPGESQRDLVMKVVDNPMESRASFIHIWEDFHTAEQAAAGVVQPDVSNCKHKPIFWISRRFSPEHEEYIQKDTRKRDSAKGKASFRGVWEPIAGKTEPGADRNSRGPSRSKKGENGDGLADPQLDLTEGAKAETVYPAPGLRTAMGSDGERDLYDEPPFQERHQKLDERGNNRQTPAVVTEEHVEQCGL